MTLVERLEAAAVQAEMRAGVLRSLADRLRSDVQAAEELLGPDASAPGSPPDVPEPDPPPVAPS